MTSHWGGGAVAYQGGGRGGGVQGGGMGASLGGGARPACIGANLKAALSRAPRSLFLCLSIFVPGLKGRQRGGALIRGGGGMETLGTPPGGGGSGVLPKDISE